MAWPLRVSTASQIVPFGPFLSTSDAVTVVTSAIAAADINVNKHNATGFVSKNSGGATYISNGYFYATFDATDTNTLGRLKVCINMTSSASLPVWFDAVVHPANIFDSLYAGTASLNVNVTSMAGSSSSANNMSSAALSIVSGSATSTGTLNVSTATVNFAFALITDGQIQNRQVIWKGDVTSGLKQQAAQVSTWTAATSTMVMSPPLSVSPVHGDTCTVF